MKNKRVLLDLNMTAKWCRAGTMVGIVRVSCELYRSLRKITDTCIVQLFRVKGREEPEIRIIDPDTWQLTDKVVTPSRDDLYLMPEIQVRGIHVDMDYPWPGFLAKYGVERCAVIHDILPIEMPEFFEPETAARMPDYVLGLFQHYSQIICVSNAVLDSVVTFRKEGRVSPFRLELEAADNDAFHSCLCSGWRVQDRLARADHEARIMFHTNVVSSFLLQLSLVDVYGSFRVVVNGYQIGIIREGGSRTESISIPAEIVDPDGCQEILLLSISQEQGSLLLSRFSLVSNMPDSVPVSSLVNNSICLAYVHEGVREKKIGGEKKANETLNRFFSRSRQEKVFLMVGTIEPRKGYDLVLDTFELLWSQGLEHKLCVIGKPGWNMDGFVERLRHHPEAGNRLLLIDNAPDDVLLAAYQEADALIQASAGEGFGLPLIEAGQYGKPVFCSDIPVFHEVGGDNVLYFSRSPEGLSECIRFFDENHGTDRIPDSRGIARRSWDDFAGDCYRLMTDQTPWPLRLEAEGYVKVPEKIRKKIVVALTYAVFPPLNGGHARVIGLYKNLASAYHVELVCMAPCGTEKTKTLIAPHLVQYVVPMSEATEAKSSQFELKSGVSSGDMGVLLFGDKTPEYAEAVRLAGQDADWIVACHPYVYPVIRSVLPGKKLIYEAQDVEYLIKKEMYHRNHVTESALQLLFDTERDCCRDSKIIMTCSEADRQDLARLYDLDPSRVIVVPNGVDTNEIEYVSVPDRLANKAKNGLSSETVGIFMGGYHEPNLDAAKVIICLAKQVRNAKIFLLGSQCRYFEDLDLPDNVALMGFLSDEEKRRVFSLVDFALNPMMSGSGTNLKMFDYMAAGVPVITTGFGSRGIDRKDLFLTVENSDLADAINDFNLSSCETRVAEARKYVETFFDWAKIADVLMEKMRNLE